MLFSSVFAMLIHDMSFIALLVLLLLLLVSIFAFVYMVIFLFGPPFIPTPSREVKILMETLDITDKDTVFDLGSGDGRLLIASALKGAKAAGWEINPFFVIWTYLLAYRFGIQNKITVHLGNFHNAPLQDASVIFLYGIVDIMPVLEKKIRERAKPKTKIVSYRFQFPNLVLRKQLTKKLFLYIV